MLHWEPTRPCKRELAPPESHLGSAWILDTKQNFAWNQCFIENKNLNIRPVTPRPSERAFSPLVFWDFQARRPQQAQRNCMYLPSKRFSSHSIHSCLKGSKPKKKLTGSKIGAIFCKIASRITTQNLKIGPRALFEKFAFLFFSRYKISPS